MKLHETTSQECLDNISQMKRMESVSIVESRLQKCNIVDSRSSPPYFALKM